MPKAHLTDIAIKALRPPRKGQETYWDQTLTGFGVRVSQGGGKSFIVMHGANRKRTSIGKYPIITLSDARTAAKRLLAEQTLGKHAPLSVGFETACNEYLAECAGRIGEGTLSGYTRQLKHHWLPAFRKSRLSAISPSDIHRRLDRLGNTPSVNGGAKLVHPGGAKLVHLTLCGTRCWGVVPVVHRRDPRCFV